MKVLFISAANSVHTVRWVNALVERKQEVILVSLPNHREEANKINEKAKVLYLPVAGTKGYYLNALEMKKIYNQCRPDVVNAHYASGYGTLVRIARIPNVLLSVWGSDVYDFPYQSKWKMEIIKKNLLYAKYLASTSHIMAEQVGKLIGDVAVNVTPFGVDIEKFKKMPEVLHSGFNIGTVKTLDSKYGIDTIIKAFAIFYRDIPEKEEVRLLIYGRGESEQELRQLCKDEGIQDQVTFCGFIPNNEIPIALNQMDVCCFGSRLNSESFGVAAVEAMACEVPVIATDVDGFREVIEPNITGYIISKDHPEQMAYALSKLYYAKEYRSQLGKNGRKRVIENYSWIINVDIMLKLYGYISVDTKTDTKS